MKKDIYTNIKDLDALESFLNVQLLAVSIVKESTAQQLAIRNI